MFLNEIMKIAPSNWTWDINNPEIYTLNTENISMTDMHLIPNLVKIEKICRIENPFMYGQFQIKIKEYEARGPAKILQLYHCTGESKIESIATTNLDYRLVKRSKFGRGVSFSPSVVYANKQANFYSATCKRAMLICDVLVDTVENGSRSTLLPEYGDTTVDPWRNVYVKYFDNEFYPKAVVYYTISSRN